MAKKRTINKSQIVRDYLKAHPNATSGEIAKVLNKQGVKVTANYVANIKTQFNKTRKAKKPAEQPAAIGAMEPAVEQAAKVGAVTIEQVKTVSQLIKTLGGFSRLVEVLDVVRELGGVKRFKELAAAIAAIEPNG